MKQDQSDIFGNQEAGTTNQVPVECLGMNFPNNEARHKNIPIAEFQSIKGEYE